MKTFKVALLGLMLSVGTLISAQEKDHLKNMMSELNLTSEQSEKITAIDAKYDSQLKAAREQMKAMGEANKPQREAAEKEIMTVLNAKQKKKFSEMKMKHEEFRKNNNGKGMERPPMGGHDRGGDEPKNRLDHLKNELDLSDAQYTKIQAIHDKYKNPKMKEAHDKLRELHEQKKNEMKAVLTPEQQQKMKEMRKMHKRK